MWDSKMRLYEGQGLTSFLMLTWQNRSWLTSIQFILTTLLLLPPSIILSMKINEKPQKRSIENRIEAPPPDPGAPQSRKMVVQHQTRHRKTEHELHNLTVRHRPLPPRPPPQRAQQVVGVHQRVHGGVGNERHGEQRLRGGQPEVAHDHHRRVVVHVEEGQPPLAATGEDDQEGVDEFEEFGEVEDVGPEEDGAIGWGLVDGEAEDVFGVGGLGEGGEGAGEGHGEGEEEEEEIMGGGDGAEEGRGERGEAGSVEEEGEGEVGEEG